MILVILKLFISVAILYGLYLLYNRKAKHQGQSTKRVNQEKPARNLQTKLVRLYKWRSQNGKSTHRPSKS